MRWATLKAFTKLRYDRRVSPPKDASIAMTGRDFSMSRFAHTVEVVVP